MVVPQRITMFRGSLGNRTLETPQNTPLKMVLPNDVAVADNLIVLDRG